MKLAIHSLPFVFALHNLEEAVGMETWSHRIPSYMHEPVQTGQFVFAVCIFTVLGFALVFFRNLYPDQESFYSAVVAFAGMLLLNVFLPHLIATVFLGYYAPGVITGVLLNLPLASFIIFRCVSLQLISWRKTIWICLAGGVAGIILVASLLRLGAKILSL
ncbi:MAG: HXXEE domain-containing protein [Leptospira sp.]|nr:HXXEE domain-containing protein [Leptospira sp.]